MIIRIIATIIILLSCSLAASRLISARLHGMISSTAGTGANQKPLPTNMPLTYFSSILEKGLFGSATVGKITPVTARASAVTPAVALSELTLIGTVTGSNNDSFALLKKTGDQDECIFRIGDTVFSNGKLVRVEKEQVVLRKGDNNITIKVPTAPSVDNPQNQQQAASQTAGTGTGQIISGNIINGQALTALVDNPGQVLTQARLLPSMKDGKIEGFRASEVKPGGVFAMLGLKNNDVLTHINSFAIDAPEKAIQVMTSLKGQSRIRIDLIRDSKPVSLSYEVR